MSTPTLPGLANELVVQIFKHLPNCRAVAALNFTSHKFYRVWRSHAAAISDAVLPRDIDCYSAAEELYLFQTTQERERGLEAETSDTDEADDAYKKVLKRNQLFTANASMVSKECTDLLLMNYSNGSVYQNIQGPVAEGASRNFTRIRYRIHCICALSFDRAAQDEYLEATSLNDLEKMQQDGIVWSTTRHYYSDSEYFRIYLKTSSARNPFDLIKQVHHDKWHRSNQNSMGL